MRPTAPALLCLGLLLAPASEAAWRVEARPLETAPWRRTFSSTWKLASGPGLSHVEGSAKELTGPFVEVALPAAPDQAPRQLEFQLGFLTEVDPPAAERCKLTWSVAGRQGSADLPLTSIHPSAHLVETLKRRFDAWLPATTVDLTGAKAATLRVAKGGDCRGGHVVLFDPKIWRRADDAPARRFFLVVTDSLSAEWFEDGRDFMPALRRFFADGGELATQVYSSGNNTHDTTANVARMQFSVRDFGPPPVRDESGGLVPSFLAQGYDAISFNSNLLLSTEWASAGFRSLLNLNAAGAPVNNENPDVLVGWTLDWLARHPDHDVFMWLWFDATHVGGPAPRVRDGLALSRAPYQGHPKFQYVEGQARSASYVDLALERLLTDPRVREGDLVFFTDHGVNFDTLYTPTPLWGQCRHVEQVANWHLAPVEARIPVGVRLGATARRKAFARPQGAETGLLEWVRAATLAHEPALDTTGWEGEPGAPILIAGHGGLGALRRGGHHLLFSGNECGPEGGVRRHLDGSPLDPAEELALDRELDRRGMLTYRRLWVDVLHRPGCRVRLEGAAPFEVEPPRGGEAWQTTWTLAMPTVSAGAAFSQVRLVADPPGCAEFDGRYTRKTLFSPLALSAVTPLAPLWNDELPWRPSKTHAQVRLRLGAERLLRRADGTLEVLPVQRAVNPLSKELKAAMQRWGYIQDDGSEH